MQDAPSSAIRLAQDVFESLKKRSSDFASSFHRRFVELEGNDRRHSGKCDSNAERLSVYWIERRPLFMMSLEPSRLTNREVCQQADLKCGDPFGNDHPPLRATVVDVGEDSQNHRGSDEFQAKE